MLITILIGAVCFVAGYFFCILMTSAQIDSRIDEIREEYRKALAEQIKKIG